MLIATSYYEPAHLGGGPIQTLKALVHAAPECFKIEVICTNHDFGVTEPLVDQPNIWLPLGKIRVKYVEGGVRNLITSFRASRDIDILYLNSLFNSHFSILPMLLWRTGLWQGTTVLVAPRGELDPGALAFKARKKRIFLTLFKLLRFPMAFTWHASSEIEANHIRKALDEKVKVVIRENETSLPPYATERRTRKLGPLRLIFASRLHEKKGLHTLLEALQGIDQEVELDIIGAFEDPDYETKCRQLIGKLSGNITTMFHGSLPREAVLEGFYKADLFVFPTAGENFGHVIAEALSQSCPVMCSPNTPWSDTLNNGGGIVVNNADSKYWNEALESFLSGGEGLWEKSARETKSSFDQWKNEAKGAHVFELTTGSL